MLKAAKYYLKKGISVVPKVPKVKKGTLVKWKPYQKRLPTLEEIEKWWAKWGDAGVAIVTGKISDLIVLDIDPDHGGFETLKTLTTQCPNTWVVRSGGGGYHIYFRYPNVNFEINNFNGNDLNLPGLDLRAEGGIIFAPPSLHPSGNRYKFKEGNTPNNTDLIYPPDWLMGVIENNIKEKSNYENSNLENKLILKKEKPNEIWNGVKEGNRNNTCASLAGKLANINMPKWMAKELLLEIWNDLNKDQYGNKAPLPKNEIKRTIDSIYKSHFG